MKVARIIAGLDEESEFLDHHPLILGDGSRAGCCMLRFKRYKRKWIGYPLRLGFALPQHYARKDDSILPRVMVRVEILRKLGMSLPLSGVLFKYL